MDTNCMNLTRFVLAEQRKHPDAHGDLSQLLTSIQSAVKVCTFHTYLFGQIVCLFVWTLCSIVKTWYFKNSYLIIIAQKFRVLFDPSRFFKKSEIFSLNKDLLSHVNPYISFENVHTKQFIQLMQLCNLVKPLCVVVRLWQNLTHMSRFS